MFSNKVQFYIFCLVFIIVIPTCKQEQSKQRVNSKSKIKENFNLQNQFDSISYSLGMNIGGHIKEKGIKRLDLVAFAKGIDDKIKNRNTTLTSDEADTYILEYFKNLLIDTIAKNIKEGDEFLYQNKKQNRVRTLGQLQYIIENEGDGENPGIDSKVSFNYKIQFINGEIIEDSFKNKRRKTLIINNVNIIKGIEMALLRMDRGAKWHLFIPPELAYGHTGYKNIIPPYKTLIVDLELIDFE